MKIRINSIKVNSKEDFKNLSLLKKIIVLTVVPLALIMALGVVVLAVGAAGIAVISVIPVVIVTVVLGLVVAVLGTVIGVTYHYVKKIRR